MKSQIFCIIFENLKYFNTLAIFTTPEKTVEIKLVGNWTHVDEYGTLGVGDGAQFLGAKTLGGVGAVEMHGCPRDVTSSFLKNTVTDGTQITVSDDTDWAVDEEIGITTSDYNMRHTEYFRITAIVVKLRIREYPEN